MKGEREKRPENQVAGRERKEKKRSRGPVRGRSSQENFVDSKGKLGLESLHDS